MKNKFEDLSGSLIADANNTPLLSFDEFKTRFTKYRQDCLFIRRNNKVKIDVLTNELGDPSELISLYNQMIEAVKDQNSFYENQLIAIKQYGDDEELSKSLLVNILLEQRKYSWELYTQKSIAELFNLNPSELFEVAKKHKLHALRIIQTPKLIAKIADSQLKDIIPQDEEIAKALATSLLSREYTVEIAKIFTELKLGVENEYDKKFIKDKENEIIYKLLVKINNYLDKKIAHSLNETTHPWTLGYFGSGYKVAKNDKQVSVPQGIYELKRHLDQLDKIAPIQILGRIQRTLKDKQEEIHDESVWKQIKRFVSYIFGYHRSQNTIQEYQHLDSLTSGKQ